MSGGYSWKFSWRKCENHLPRDNLGEQKVLESAFSRISKRLKSKILATMVTPPGYTGFITNLPFWATRKLERMLYAAGKVKLLYTITLLPPLWVAEIAECVRKYVDGISQNLELERKSKSLNFINHVLPQDFRSYRLCLNKSNHRVK